MQPTGPRIRVIELLMIVITLAIGASWFAGLLPMHLEARRIKACTRNIWEIGRAMHQYAVDGDIFPSQFQSSQAGDINVFGYRNRRPEPPDAPSPTADLWLLLRAQYLQESEFVCPATTDRQDPIRDPMSAFDFAGPEFLSYAYVYQYHPARRRLGFLSNPVIPILADSNPYLKGGILAAPVADRGTAARGNSRNHRPRHGQNVTFVDGHVEFVRTPSTDSFPSPPASRNSPNDNIYTTHADGEPGDPGRAPSWTRIQIGSKSDYCLVP